MLLSTIAVGVDGETPTPTADLNGRASSAALPGACTGRTVLRGEATTVRQSNLNNAQTCEFLIEPVEKALTSILFKFNSFQMESNADFLYVYQGSGPSKTLVCAALPFHSTWFGCQHNCVIDLRFAARL